MALRSRVIHHIRNEIGQMTFGKPVLQRCRHQEGLFGVIRTESLAHVFSPGSALPPIMPLMPCKRYYSDRLLDPDCQRNYYFI